MHWIFKTMLEEFENNRTMYKGMFKMNINNEKVNPEKDEKTELQKQAYTIYKDSYDLMAKASNFTDSYEHKEFFLSKLNNIANIANIIGRGKNE